jgi:hypothetical protein
MEKAVVPEDSTTRVFEAVCKIILVSGAKMTGIAKRLEKNGFLLRKRDPNAGLWPQPLSPRRQPAPKSQWVTVVAPKDPGFG